ncbi:hypothetical protein HN803_04390 [candidate division WWE3 bacterium]|jgi:hypothetical protein|nr:hypothetical protein [candidate division WWE3 bacterium]
MAKNYYTIKKAQQEEQDILALLLGTISDLDSLVTDMVFSQGKISPEIGDEVNKRVEVAKAKIVKAHGMVSSLSFQKGLSRDNI